MVVISHKRGGGCQPPCLKKFTDPVVLLTFWDPLGHSSQWVILIEGLRIQILSGSLEAPSEFNPTGISHR